MEAKVFKNILAAIDGSDASSKALEIATEISEKFGSNLHLLHVVRNMQVPLNPGIMEQYQDLERQRHDLLSTAGEQLLNQAKRVAEAKGVKVLNSDIGSGDPATAVVKYAAQKDIDLIIIGSRGLGGVENLLLGSVSRKVSNTTKANCLIVK